MQEYRPVGTVGVRSATAVRAAAFSFARSWMMVVSPRAMRSLAAGSCFLISATARILRSGILCSRPAAARVPSRPSRRGAGISISFRDVAVPCGTNGLISPISGAGTVGASSLPDDVYGRLDVILPRASRLAVAARASPALTARFSFAILLLRSTMRSTIAAR